MVNLYKFEEERYGTSVVRFLSFKNDKEHKLGRTPIPGGTLKVYRAADAQEHLSYTGQSSFKYIPVDQDVELNLGAVSDIVVEPTLMETKTDNYRFDKKRNVSGWDEIRTFEVTVKNTRDTPGQGGDPPQLPDDVLDAPAIRPRSISSRRWMRRR